MSEYTDEYVKGALFDQVCQARQVDDLDRPALEAIEREVDVKFAHWLAKIREEAHRVGYRTGRDDVASGAFIGGPNHEAFRKALAQAWEKGAESCFLSYDVRGGIDWPENPHTQPSEPDHTDGSGDA